MDQCPYCTHDLGDLDPVLEQLSFNKIDGEYFFNSACCNRPLRAFSNVGAYYVEPTDSSSKPKMIAID